MATTQQRGVLTVLVAAAGYAFLPIWTKLIYATSQLEPMDVMIWRFMVATPTILIVFSV